jgi:hypothetical protein
VNIEKIAAAFRKERNQWGSQVQSLLEHLIAADYSITRSIAGCRRFFTLSQCFDLPA